jgi:hypothetical protein
MQVGAGRLRRCNKHPVKLDYRKYEGAAAIGGKTYPIRHTLSSPAVVEENGAPMQPSGMHSFPVEWPFLLALFLLFSLLVVLIELRKSALCIRTDGDSVAVCNGDSVGNAAGQFDQYSAGRISAGEGNFRNGGAPPRDAVWGAGGASMAGDGVGDQRRRSANSDLAVDLFGAQEPNSDG